MFVRCFNHFNETPSRACWPTWNHHNSAATYFHVIKTSASTLFSFSVLKRLSLVKFPQRKKIKKGTQAYRRHVQQSSETCFFLLRFRLLNFNVFFLPADFWSCSCPQIIWGNLQVQNNQHAKCATQKSEEASALSGLLLPWTTHWEKAKK